MGAKSAIEIEGFEYDWLAVDGDEHVALFSTAGAGYAPAGFLRDTDAHEAAIAALLALPASTVAARARKLAPEYENTWQLVAERGLYAYDSNPTGGPYHLIAAPARPVRISDLPAAIADAVRSVAYPTLRFAELETITDELLVGD